LKYLDPQFTDHITVPDAMKLEFILAGEKQDNLYIFIRKMSMALTLPLYLARHVNFGNNISDTFLALLIMSLFCFVFAFHPQRRTSCSHRLLC
jgi:hypothetical protein